MGVVGRERALLLVGTADVVEAQHVGRRDVAGRDVVAPIAVLLSLLNEGHGEVVQVGKRAVPRQCVVQVPVEGLRRVAVRAAVGSLAVGQLGRHPVAVVEPLVARCYVELVGEAEGQCHLGVEDGVQDGVALLEVEILLLEVVVVTAVGGVARARILHFVAVGIEARCVG